MTTLERLLVCKEHSQPLPSEMCTARVTVPGKGSRSAWFQALHTRFQSELCSCTTPWLTLRLWHSTVRLVSERASRGASRHVPNKITKQGSALEYEHDPILSKQVTIVPYAKNTSTLLSKTLRRRPLTSTPQKVSRSCSSYCCTI